MPNGPNQKDVPLQIVGSTKFGRYPKISIEQTYNMIISDNWLVPLAGYSVISAISPSGIGRGIYSSNTLMQMVIVIDNKVFTAFPNASDTALFTKLVGTINTSSGDVFIAENNASQIAICDMANIYIYDYGNNTFQQVSTPFTPGYIEFHDTYFLSVDLASNNWWLSAQNDGTSWTFSANTVGEFQTKPNNPIAVVRVPGKGNLIFVMGPIVTEMWYDTGALLFPYQRNSYQSIDYGCVNPATIATNDTYVAWIGINEKSGPVFMVSEGDEPLQISNDGINFLLSSLNNPQDSYGFLWKQDGHILYQATFYSDNISFIYDFNTKSFFSASDQYLNYHIAKKVVFFNDSYYFISINDGNLYLLDSSITSYNGNEIPRVRCCPTFRLPDNSRFVVNSLTFTLEQGVDSTTQRVDLSVSNNGGQTFGSDYSITCNQQGFYMNKLVFWSLGATNEFIPQFKFYSDGRFVINNGMMSIYQ